MLQTKCLKHFRHQNLGSAYLSFCNFIKLTIQWSRPLHAVKVWNNTSGLNSLQPSLFMCSMTAWRRACLKACRVSSHVETAGVSLFECSHLEQQLTFLPLSKIRWHILYKQDCFKHTEIFLRPSHTRKWHKFICRFLGSSVTKEILEILSIGWFVVWTVHHFTQ